jgi:integrase
LRLLFLSSSRFHRLSVAPHNHRAWLYQLATGRRLAEVAGLRWSHLHFDVERIRLHFPRVKDERYSGAAGPASLGTTGRYLAALRSSDNPYAEAIAELLGL